MAYSRKDVDKTKQNAKKFVRYQEGAEKYSIACCIQHFSWHFVMTSSAKIQPMAYWQR